jgi:hypothetical protein
MLKILAIVFALALAGVAGLAATKPDSFQVIRALRMQAPPPAVFSVISDFAQWGAWSPWVAKDPALEISTSDKTTGMGAMYEWSGNRKVGRGRLEIVTVVAPENIRMKLTIFEPALARNIVEFSLSPVGAFTKVSWSMAGPMDFKTKLMSVFTPMDVLIGPDFELGLERLKALVEQQSRP